MNVRKCIGSIQELEQKFSPRFKRRVELLVCTYRKRMRGLTDALIYRALCVAMVFVSEAMNGDMALACSFDDMLYGRTAEKLVYEDAPVVFDDEASDEIRLVWDVICLLLEEYEPEREMPQMAFDVAGCHSSLAYDLIGEEEREGSPVPVVVPAAVAKPQMTQQPPMVQQPVAAIEQTPTDLHRQLAEKERELAMMRQLLAESNVQIAELRARNEQLENEVTWHRNRNSQMVNMLMERLSVPSNLTNNHFGQDSVHFGAGSTMNGDVGGR